MSTDEKRRLLRQYCKAHKDAANEWAERGYPPREALPPFPAELVDMACGAQTRAGTPCKITALYINGRCKWHGGCSTGPKSEAGKQQARENGKKGGRPRKPKS